MKSNDNTKNEIMKYINLIKNEKALRHILYIVKTIYNQCIIGKWDT